MSDISEMVKELSIAASLMNDELGEYWSALCNLDGTFFGGRDDFQQAWEKEVMAEYVRLPDEFELRLQAGS